MASSIKKLLLLILSLFSSPIWALQISSSSLNQSPLSSIKSFCKTTPYPSACFDSLKISISININPNISNYLLQYLQIAIFEATKLSNLLSSIGQTNFIEKQKGSIQDCKELHQITISSLQKSVSRLHSTNSKKLSYTRAYLSAALTNKNTCLEGLDSASGSFKPILINSLTSAYQHVSNSLSILSNSSSPKGGNNRRLLGFPSWISRKNRRILQSSIYDYDPSAILSVAAGGTGNFSTINDAISFAPNNSYARIIIYIKEGIYEENVEIPSYKTNIVLIGDGSNVTFIFGNRSYGDGWTTFRSATLAVSGDGFLARDITIENRAGPEKHQAVALRVNADLTALYRCKFNGYQDTLYVHSFRQFYRECDIFGTIDFICGNAAVVFQACNIVTKMPMLGQFTVITAQSRESPYEYTGISIQNCSILGTNELFSNSNNVKSYLGRPWREYSQTVLLESYIDGSIDPIGWKEWSDDQSLETLYYGEYKNFGPGSSTDNRVNWTGFHVMNYYDASNFTVAKFISGDDWLKSTSFPYEEDGIN